MAARLSPSANLLRNSRLFSLPPTLSPPRQPPTSSFVSESDTATLPYPIRPSITTPDSSLARGDWGLKRPLPAKSTTRSSSSPIVRVNHLDTYEHITDFESAADHTLTLKKWQELSLPISIPHNTGVPVQIGGGRHESVFDTTVDNTHESPNVQTPNTQRYRFRGPWLAGQTPVDFEAYLKKVRHQKPGFLQKLRQLLSERQLVEMRRTAMDEGKDLNGLQNNYELSDEEFESALRALRADPASLGPAIYQLLDLAPPPIPPTDRISMSNWAHSPSNVSSTEYGNRGPPATHPSAGLSYLRTKAHIGNHPIAGPQRQTAPVQARILRPKKRIRGNNVKALAGVAGIVTEDINSHAFREFNAPQGITELNPEIPGGAKYWVQPVRASVNPDGKISLAIDRANESTMAIHGVSAPEESLPDYVHGEDRSFGPSSSRHRRRVSPFKVHTDANPNTEGEGSQGTKQFLNLFKKGVSNSNTSR